MKLYFRIKNYYFKYKQEGFVNFQAGDPRKFYFRILNKKLMKFFYKKSQ